MSIVKEIVKKLPQAIARKFDGFGKRH